MKCLITGDWHLGILTHGVQNPDGFNSRMRDLQQVIISAVNKIGPLDCFIHLGDLFHTNTPSPAAITIAAEIFNVLSSCFKHLFVIGGNHDYAVTRVNPVDIFSSLGRIKCITKPEIVDIGIDQFVFIPHSNEIDIRNFLNGLPVQNKRRTVFCHTTFSGAITGSEDFMLAAGVHSIPRNIAPIIFSGHIHKSQVLVSTDRSMAEVYYPGSPMILDFGEIKDKKEIIIYDSETKAVNFVPAYEPRKFYQLDSIDKNQWPDLKDAVVKIVINGSAPDNTDQIVKELKMAGVHSIAGIRFISDVKVEEIKESSLKLSDQQLMWDYLQKVAGNDALEVWNEAWNLVSSTGLEIK